MHAFVGDITCGYVESGKIYLKREINKPTGVASSETILIRPEDIRKGRAFFYRDKIINEIRKSKELDVIGVSNAISLACSAVQMSTLIAGVYIKEACLDYIPLPILQRVSGIFLALTLESEVDWETQKAKFEEDMKLSFDRDGELVVVSKNLSPEEMVPLCLSKLATSQKLKIMASGHWINQAATLVLDITKGGISKGPVGIELIVLSTKEFKIAEVSKTTTVLEIFLRKGKPTEYTRRHNQVLSRLKRAKY